jgi:putative NIF3 family GTP cyclohydrolase 1 type 2
MHQNHEQGRREFLMSLGAAGTCAALPGPDPAVAAQAGATPPALTVRGAIDAIIKAVPGAPRRRSVDTVKCGDPSQPLSGIVTTFLASAEVVQKTVGLGANLIITHEPIFYNHLDETDWLAADRVYWYKRRMIVENRLTVWRFHDYWHLLEPDGILTGVLRLLEWKQPARSKTPEICEIAPMPLIELARFLKKKFASPYVRIVGDPRLECRRVGVSPGASGGRSQIRLLGRNDVDVVVCGEVAEWETSEYARDALTGGMKKGLIVLGHVQSEEAGMQYLAEWLRPRFPGVEITHVPTGSAFTYV